MKLFEHEALPSGHGSLIASNKLNHIAIGTFVTTDLARVRNFLENFNGMECVVEADGRMLARDRRAKYMMENTYRDFFVLEITQVEAIIHPQGLFNHWGFVVSTEDEVRRLHQLCKDRAQEFGFKKINPITPMHGSYGFYVVDVDDNWWEYEFRRGKTNSIFFSEGDFDEKGRENFTKHNLDIKISHIPSPILEDDVYLTHGTTSVKDIKASRAFYEDILQLRYVCHTSMSSSLSGAGDIIVVAVQAGAKLQDQGQENRYVILVDADSDVRAFHERVVAAKEKYGLLLVEAIQPCDEGGISFLLRTNDQIWFEVSSRSRSGVIELFSQKRA